VTGVAAGAGGATVNQAANPIQHVVVIMEENHTFDNYFGNYPGANGATLPPASNPAPHDIDHSGPRTRFAINDGQMNGFDPLGQVQYQQSDIPVYWAYAQHFGLGENFYISAASSSTPNHIAMIAGQTGGNDQTIHVNGCLSPDNAVVLERDAAGDASFGQPCYNIPSIPEEATAAGLTWKYYGQAPVWDAPQYIQAIKNTPPVQSKQIITDAQANQLPNISFVTPGQDAQSDHPPQPTQPAQNFVSSVVNAIMRSPAWSSTAIFVTWDDFGGWYDHVPPRWWTASAWAPGCRCWSSRRGPSPVTSAATRASSPRSTSSSRRRSACPAWAPATAWPALRTSWTSSTSCRRPIPS